MIKFDNWLIYADGEIIARQFDNLTRTLAVTGDMPDGWDWAALVRVGSAMDIIPLTAAEGALSAVLTAQQLSQAGYYTFQLRGTRGELVKHTNTVNVYIPESLSGDKQWPVLPSEFTQLENRVNDATSRAEQAAENAEGYTSHPPVIGINGNWWTWNGDGYVDTGNPSQGEGGNGGGGESGSYYASLSAAISDLNNDVTDNALLDTDGARVRVFTAENGITAVALLGDVSESTAMTVNKDIDLVLAGHTLSLTDAKAYITFAEGTTCTINGEVAGSSIIKGEIVDGVATITAGKTADDRVCFIEANGDSLTIQGGEFHLAVKAGYIMHAIRAVSTAKKLNLFDCEVSVENTAAQAEAQSYAVSSSCVSVNAGRALAQNVTLRAKTYETVSVGFVVTYGAEAGIDNCNITAITTATAPQGKDQNYAQGVGVYASLVRIENTTIKTHAPSGSAKKACSAGIKTTTLNKRGIPTLYVAKSKVYATHAAIESIGNLYVRDCLLSGYSHGGLYALNDATCQAYLKDTTLWNFYYLPIGDFDADVREEAANANCYIGVADDEGLDPSPGGDVYMDGCVFGYEGQTDNVGRENAKGSAFCVRDSKYGTTPSRLFISNSKFIGHDNFRVQGQRKDSNGNLIGEKDGEVHIGRGCNFTSGNVYPYNKDNNGVDSSGRIEETSELYRKHYVGEVLTAEDFAVLLGSGSASYPNGDEVSY